jgi:hypothetical protein
VLVEIDAEVGGEDEGEPAALLEGGFPLMDEKVGAYETGGGAVEGGGQAVGGAGAGESRGRRRGWRDGYGGRVRLVAGAAAFSGAGGEEEAQP